LASKLPQPQLWIIAGPNGSGKSSAYSLLGVESPKDTVWIINPDLLAKRIADNENLPADDANLQAVIRIESWLYTSIDAYQTVGVETVLSSSKYRRLVETAQAKGFEINLVYVYLDDVELNIQRVKMRYAKGGHDVPQDKIRERRNKSFQQLGWFFAAADKAFIVNNDGASLRVVATKDNDGFSIEGDTIPEIIDAILQSYPELKDLLDRPLSDFSPPD
jgi:predicted ABC-type ATPase